LHPSVKTSDATKVERPKTAKAKWYDRAASATGSVVSNAAAATGSAAYNAAAATGSAIAAAPGAAYRGVKSAASAAATTAVKSVSAENFQKTKEFNEKVAQSYANTLGQPKVEPSLPELQTALSTAKEYLEEVKEKLEQFQGKRTDPEKTRLLREFHQAEDNVRTAEQRVNDKLEGKQVLPLSGGKKRRVRTFYETAPPTNKRKFRRRRNKTQKGRRRF
jgi:hypothetical protein